MNILVTGAKGMVGTSLVNNLKNIRDNKNRTRPNIKIDDISIKELTRENVHELFTMVLQDTWVFNGTVLENIIYKFDTFYCIHVVLD